ncbi:MAG: hypothetical protein KA715_13625 [Xanthomonadaceae bacterium]|nr:hypothetical protein [Xanthomonadaceae bacterium]
MKNLTMMILVALMVLGVVYIVKHRKQSEPANTPAFNAGVSLESQPPGEYDGEYTLDTYTCNEQKAKEQKVPEAQVTRLKIRGMNGRINKKVDVCDVAQYLTLVPNESIKNPAIKSVQFKQNRLECSPECKCYPLLIGTSLGVFNLTKKEIQVVERVRSEKVFCNGKLPVIFKYSASVNSADKK